MCIFEEMASPVKMPLCCRDVPLHGAQRFRRSTRRWYAVRFEEGEEHADAEKEEPSTSEEAHSRHPQHAAEMICNKKTSARKYTAAELKGAVAAARRHCRPGHNEVNFCCCYRLDYRLEYTWYVTCVLCVLCVLCASQMPRTGRIEQRRRKRSSTTPRSAVYPTRDRSRWCAVCAARMFACQSVVRSAVCFEARPFEFYGFVRTRRDFWEGFLFPQPRAQRSEMFLLCLFYVWCGLCSLSQMPRTGMIE